MFDKAKHSLVSLQIAVLVTAVIGVIALYVGQRKLLFPAPDAPLPSDLGVGVEIIALDLGYALLALPERAPEPAPLIIYAHGNGGVAHRSLASFAFFRARGFAVLLLEYPGYGGAPGSPSAHAMVTSAISAFDAVVQRDDIDSNRIVVYGYSIGGGVAAQLAAQRSSSALILESTFTTLDAVVAEAGYPAFLLKDQFDNASVVSKLEIPILLYHGTNDSLVAAQHSDALAELAKQPTLLKANCGHDDCPRPWDQVMQFLRSYGIIDEALDQE